MNFSFSKGSYEYILFLNWFIWRKYGAQAVPSTPNLSEPGRIDNKEVLEISPISKTGASLTDAIYYHYHGTSFLWGLAHLQEMQSILKTCQQGDKVTKSYKRTLIIETMKGRWLNC